MKFTCEKALLQAAISTTSRAVSPKSSIPALEGILVEAGNDLRLTGYNLETGIRTVVPAEIQEEGTLVLGARLFGDIIRKMPDDMVSFQADNYMVHIKCGMSEFHILGTDPEEFPELPTVEYQNSLVLEQSKLKAMISQTLFAKWNAYGYDENSDYSGNENLWFQTAWSAPHPIIEKLAEMYPDIVFEHEWADEDLGANCGRKCYRNGECAEEYYPESQKESIEFACRIWDYDPAELDLMLNKAENGYINIENEGFDLIELFGKTALFTNERLTNADIPKGLYCYHLRHSDDGDRFCSVEPKVGVNHGGSVITKEPIDFGKQGYISFTEDTEPNFTGGEQTLGEFLKSDVPQENEVIKLC